MHLPDGFLSAPVCLATGALSAAVLALALRHTRQRWQDRQAPLLGVTAAFIFSAQMINYPIGFGASGHLLGSALAALLLGPLEACLILALVLTLQCLLFADGGLTALGANLLNMGIVAALSATAINTLLERLGRWLTPRLTQSHPWFLARAALAAWASVVLASAACAGELLLSGTTGASPALVVGLLTSVHALIGLGEAFITVAVLQSVLAARPDWIAAGPHPAIIPVTVPPLEPEGS